MNQVMIEWQFEGADLELVESWLTERFKGPGIAIDPGSKKDLLDTYYDTEDWRVYRAGYALRVRFHEPSALLRPGAT